VKLPKDLVQGFALQYGGPNSHTAILAKSMGVPAILNLGETLSYAYDGQTAILDGYEGTVYIDPCDQLYEEYQKKREQVEQGAQRLLRLRGKENQTIDGRRIDVYANAGSMDEVDVAITQDAGGIGLFRSEMLYFKTKEAPGEEAQYRTYQGILHRMRGKPVTIRTLDIGADKRLPYLNQKKEENPALGLRGIRLSLAMPQLLETQLRALYRASVHGNLKILYPMITSVAEGKRIRQIEEKIKKDLYREMHPFAKEVPSGFMIETPAAALISDLLAQEADFFSIGTNDLTQYTLAMDRQYDYLHSSEQDHHPAVYRLIETTVRNAHAKGIGVGICGELASDLTMTEWFIRIGMDSLSVVPSMILPLREHILGLNLTEAFDSIRE
jgi:phosphotransferase system enzyme I (PtsI)